MIIRNNFVSNSSSTNFIVCLDEDINVEDYRTYLMKEMGYFSKELFREEPKGTFDDPTIDQVMEDLSGLQMGDIIDQGGDYSEYEYIQRLFEGAIDSNHRGNEPLKDKLIYDYRADEYQGHIFNACYPLVERPLKKFLLEREK